LTPQEMDKGCRGMQSEEIVNFDYIIMNMKSKMQALATSSLIQLIVSLLLTHHIYLFGHYLLPATIF